MPLLRIFFSGLFLLFFTVAQTQTINSDKSHVNFEIRNMKARTVTGFIGGMRGEALFKEADLNNATFEVCIDANSINTSNKKRDDHLRKEDYFFVEKFPDICFTSSNIEKAGSQFLAKGQLTIRGVVKDVEIPFEYADNTLTGKLDLNRMDYGVGPAGTFMVADEVAITIVCRLE